MLKEFPDLKIHGREGAPSHILIFFVIINGFQLRQVFYNLLDFGCPIFVLGTFGAHVSVLSAAEAESLLHTFLAFFSSKFSNFNDIYVHGAGVTSFGGGGEGVVGLMSGFRVLLGDLFSVLPLGLERNGLFVPVFDGRGDSVHRHNSTHEGGRDSGREISNEDILVSDTCQGRVVFEVGDVFNEGRRVGVVLPLGHAFGGEPGDGGPSDIMVFECGFELCDEVRERAHGYGCSGDGVLSERGGPSEGGSFGHIGEGEGDHFVVSVVDFVVD